MVITWITVFLICLFCLYLILSPFFLKGAGQAIKIELAKKEEQLYAALNEAEMDLHMGKITRLDFQQLKAVYELRIMSLQQNGKGMPHDD